MGNLSSRRAPVNPGRPDRGAPVPRRPIDPHKLEGPDRRAWEESIFINADLKGSRLHLARVLLDEFCWGKCWCYPGDDLLARKCGLSTATIGRCLRDLVKLEVIRAVKARGRRWIVFPDHPHAAAFLAGLEPAGPASEVSDPIEPIPPGPAREAADQSDRRVDQIDRPVPQNDRQSVLVKRASEARIPACAKAEPLASGEMERSPSGLNEPTNCDRLRPAPAPRPTGPTSWRLPEIPDLARAPIDDPVIAAELARRTRAREAAAAVPTRDEILAAVLGATVGDTPGVDSASEAHRVGADVHDAAPAVDPEAATIEALSKLGPGATRGEVLAATLRLTSLFRDPGSRAYYRSVCNEVARGQLPARVPIAAVGSARGPDVRNPGAAFTAHIKRARAAAEARPRRNTMIADGRGLRRADACPVRSPVGGVAEDKPS